MWKIFKSLAGRKEPVSVDSVESDADAISQIKALQIELEERDKRIVGLEKEIERLRSGQERTTSDAVDAQLESFFSESAAPICQLLTQSFLIEKEQKPVESRDVMRLVRRLIRVFEDAGLEVRGSVGDLMPFDPNYHEPLSGDHSLSNGAQVNVRLSGLAYSGRIIRKAGVEPVEE